MEKFLSSSRRPPSPASSVYKSSDYDDYCTSSSTSPLSSGEKYDPSNESHQNISSKMSKLGVIRKRCKSSKSTATSTSTAPAPSSSNAESLGPLVICRTNPKDGTQVYICKRLNCKQTITIYQNLVRHDRIHRKAKPWRCGVCGHKSSQNSAVKNHIRRKHFNPIWRKKKSKNLEKRFDDYLLKNLQKDSELLQKEKELFANAERITLPSYKCLLARYERLTLQYRFECRIDPDCQWRFTKNESRLVHEREHIGIKPYQVSKSGFCEQKYQLILFVTYQSVHLAGKELQWKC